MGRGVHNLGANSVDTRYTIEELVYRSCLALDDKDFKGYLNLCDGGFRYMITTHSPEIRKDMVWLDLQQPAPA